MSPPIAKLSLAVTLTCSLFAFQSGRLLVARDPSPEVSKERTADSLSKDDLLRFMDASIRQTKPTLLPFFLRDAESIKRMSRLSREDLHKYFMFDLRRMIKELETELAAGRLTSEELAILDPNNFFELELSIEGLRPNLWNSRLDEVIYNDGETKVTRKYHDWYEIENVSTSKKSELVFLPDAILWEYDTDDGGQDMIDFGFSNSGELSRTMQALLELLGVDPNSDAAKEMTAAAEKEANSEGKGSEDPNAPKPTSGDGGEKPVTSEDSSLVDDFVDEAQKAWDLFVEMLDDAVDYGPDYVDHNDPIIKYTAGLHRLTDLYMEIKLAAIINSDRTTNPMGEVTSDDAWLQMMLVIAFYRPAPDSDPVDRPQRADRDISGVELDFDGAIDYGEDYWPGTVDPDDIPRGPVGL